MKVYSVDRISLETCQVFSDFREGEFGTEELEETFQFLGWHWHWKFGGYSQEVWRRCKFKLFFLSTYLLLPATT